MQVRKEATGDLIANISSQWPHQEHVQLLAILDQLTQYLSASGIKCLHLFQTPLYLLTFFILFFALFHTPTPMGVF